MQSQVDELRAQLREVLESFGRATMENQRLLREAAIKDEKIAQMELDKHHDNIRIMGLTEDKAHLISTIKQKVETVRMGINDDETAILDPVEVVEPAPKGQELEPQIVRLTRKKNHEPLMLFTDKKPQA